MGNRASIAFVKGTQSSPVLFSHWEGSELFDWAEEFANQLKQDALKHGPCLPLFRLEPGIVMLNFIRHLFTHLKPDELVTSGWYIERDESKGDNSDNGHVDIDLNAPIKEEGEE